VARDRIELPTRGFSVRYEIFQSICFNRLYNHHATICSTRFNWAEPIHANITHRGSTIT